MAKMTSSKPSVKSSPASAGGKMPMENPHHPAATAVGNHVAKHSGHPCAGNNMDGDCDDNDGGM